MTTGDRREQILGAAREIATEEGTRALTVRGVAARAGIGPSTLRYYFPAQRDLYDAVLGELLHAQVEDLRIADRSVPPGVRLTECLQQFLPPDDARIHELETWLAGYSSAPIEGADQHGRLLETMSRHAADRVDGWLAVLEAEGELRHADRERHASMVFAVIDGLCLALLGPGGITTVADARDLLAEVVERTVVGP